MVLNFKTINLPDKNKLLNFRPVFPGEPLTEARVFRSISPDLVNTEAIGELRHRHNIRTIIDLQSKRNYERFAENGAENPINDHYSTFFDNGIKKKPIKLCPSAEQETSPRRHYIIEFLNIWHYVHTFWCLSIWQKVMIVYYLIRHTFIKDNYFEIYACIVHVGPRGLMDQLKTMLLTSQNGVRAIFRILVDESSYPVLINCTIGKDRTGLIVTLILDLMEESEVNIIAEFVESQIQLKPIEDQIREMFLERGLSEDFVGAKHDVIVGLLEHIRGKYGGAKAYLQSIGMTNAEILQIKRNLKKLVK